MKIVFIGQKGIPVTFGGVEYHVDRLSRGLAEQGHDVLVYVRSWYTDKKKKRYRGVKLVHIPTIKTKHLDASIHSFLCSIHAVFSGADIIHYHCIGPSFFSFIPRIFGKKIVATIHRQDWATEKWGKLARIFLKTGEYLSSKVPHETIVVSKDLQKYIRNKYQADSIHISHGIELPKIVPVKMIKKKYNLIGKDYILFMGRLAPEKRVDWVIKSYQNLKKPLHSQNAIKLVIAGGSSATDDYVRKLKEISQDNPDIVYTGYVTGVEKAELLSNALIFIMPSHLEGYPIALLEAKCYGNCCLVSDIPPHREAIINGRDGILFDTDRFSDLLNQLQNLVDNLGKTDIIGKNAQEIMKRKIGWNDGGMMWFRKPLRSTEKSVNDEIMISCGHKILKYFCGPGGTPGFFLSGIPIRRRPIE